MKQERDGRYEGTVVEMERRKEENVEGGGVRKREKGRCIIDREKAQAHVSMLRGWPEGS